MSIHEDNKVNDNSLIWLQNMYVTHGEVKTPRGTVHKYFGIAFYLSEKGKVKVDMIDCMAAMVDDFPTMFKPDDTAPNPTTYNLFVEGITDDLDTEQATEYHKCFVRVLFACKKARPDIGPTVAALFTRVKDPNKNDWHKLHQLLHYIN